MRRCIGLDVHRDFAEAAIWQEGGVRLAGRIETTPEALRLFAASLCDQDEVAIEATCNTHAIARLLERHVSRVVVSNPVKTRAIAEAKVKTDKVDAQVLAQLLAAGFLPSVWLAEGHSAVAPVYLYRFDFATPMLRLLRIAAAHATELPFVWGNLVSSPKDPTFKLGGLKTGRVVSERVRARWVNFATQGKPAGLPGEPEWLPYQEADRTSLLIGREDTAVSDIDTDIRATWGQQILNFR